MKLLLLRALAASGLLLAGSQQPAPTAELTPGQPLERQIAGASADQFTLELPAGWFIHVRVDQLGADVALRLVDPTNLVMAERDRAWASADPEPVSVVTRVGGRHLLTVTAKDPAGSTGRYRIQLKDRRPATDGDRRREQAERRTEEGHRLQAPSTLDQAIPHYEAAREIWRELGETEWLARTLMQLGWAHRYRGSLDAALTVLSEVVTLWRSLGDESNEAVALNVIGMTHLQRGNARDALEVETRAVRLAERAGNMEAYAAALGNLAAVYWKLGDRKSEVRYLQQAIEANRKLGPRADLETLLHNRGVTLTDFGEYQEALVNLREALNLSRGKKNRRSEAAALNSIAQVYHYLGLPREALDYHQQALAIRRTDQDRAGIGQSLNNIGLVHRALAQRSEAQKVFEESLQLTREMKNRAGEATVLQNLGVLAYQQRDFDRSQVFLQDALRIADELGNLASQASISRHLGYLLAARDDYPGAEQFLRRGIDLSRQVRDPVTEVSALQELALVAARKGALTDARAHLETATSLIESRRRLLLGDAFRAAFLSTSAGVNADYIEILMRLHEQEPGQGHDGRALEAVEAFRARSLLDSLQEARVDVSRDLNATQVAKVRDLQLRIDMAAREESDLLAARRQDALGPLRATLSRLLTELNELRGQLQTENPRVAGLTGAQPLRLPEIQSQLLDAQSVVLEYSLGRDRSFLWVVTPTALHSFVLPPGDQIEALARTLHDQIATRNRRASGDTAAAWRLRVNRTDAAMRQTLAVLSKMLLEPAGALLGGKRLLIVASGALQYVPFAALPAPGRPDPLVIAHELVLLPSASTLSAIRRERVGRPPSRSAMAVVADPVFASDDIRLTARPVTSRPRESGSSGEDDAGASLRAASGSGPLTRLRYSRDEALAIMALTRPADRMVALDFSANRETVMNARLEGYRAIHLATHGFVNSDHPELSGLVLSMVDESGKPMDGFVRLHQIYNMNLPVDLVVLSACQTALGTEIKGEGLMSLTRGFMYAGASSVVASLWKVDDQATAELMKLFYRQLLGSPNRPAAYALRAAQIELRKQPRWHSPYYWAGFTLQGDWK
jgi:CHAT domain-containing protein/tetratricopeptide (TPR) repeat protein